MADFPSIEPDLEEIALIANNQVYNSPLTGQAQTASLTGAKWQCTPTFSNRNGKEARDLRAFLFDQEGVSGRFNYYPASIDNIGTHAGGGVVDGAGQTGKELVTKGWDADQPLLFSAGDYLTVNGEMKMVTADVGTTDDRIVFSGSNTLADNFAPWLWYGEVTDPDGSITQVSVQNPSGASDVGEVEQTGASTILIYRTVGSPISVINGDKLYACMIVKNININTEIEFFFDFASLADDRARVVVSTGVNTWPGSGVSVKHTPLSDDFYLIECEKVSTGVDTVNDIRTVFLDGDGEIPAVGSKCYIQAGFAGVSSDFPASPIANATIPITPAIRVSPSDENAIEVENPYFPARLDTDDMSRLQVSAPVIYNTTLSIVEDF